MIVTNPLRVLMIERDNLQPSYFWRNPYPQKTRSSEKVRRPTMKVNFLEQEGWKENMTLWRDPLTGNMLAMNKAYYIALARKL